MIAPLTIEALIDVAKALGFKLIIRTGLALPIGIDADDAALKVQYALLRGDEIAFDGTARECSAYLIAYRDLRTTVLGAVRAIETTQLMPEMNASTMCQARDKKGERCIRRAGHEGFKHATLAHWEDL